MKAIIRRSLPAALTATLVVGAAVAIPAVAAPDDSEVAAETAETDGPGLPGIGHRLGHGLEDGEFAERLAAELGLETDEVQDAIDAVKEDLIGERIDQAVENGHLTEEQAEELAQAIADGDREAAKEILGEARLAGLEERLAEKVEAGEITQEQADEILERAEDGDFPRHRGRHGDGPRGGDGPLGAEAVDTTNT